MTLVLENVSKQFGKHRVIDNLSVAFQPGTKYILRGRSGAGKSTILNIIARFDDDYQGDITYDSGNLKTIKKVIAKDDISAEGEATMSKFTGTPEKK